MSNWRQALNVKSDLNKEPELPYKTGWELYTDDELVKKYEDFEHRKYELSLHGVERFFDLKKEMRKRNIYFYEDPWAK
jgi:hypothetical protein